MLTCCGRRMHMPQSGGSTPRGRGWAAGGLGIKEPTVLQSFSPSPFFRGNPNLLPERSRSAEVGVEQRFAGDRGARGDRSAGSGEGQIDAAVLEAPPSLRTKFISGRDRQLLLGLSGCHWLLRWGWIAHTTLFGPERVSKLAGVDRRGFASDNASTIHPEVLAAIDRRLADKLQKAKGQYARQDADQHATHEQRSDDHELRSSSLPDAGHTTAARWRACTQPTE